MEEPRIDKTVYTGRPENTEGRLEKEIAVYDFLDSLGVEYKRERSRLKQNFCPNRSEQPDFPLQTESRWRNI